MQYLQDAKKNYLELDQTIQMDETAIYLEDPWQITVNESRKRHVSHKSTGFVSL